MTALRTEMLYKSFGRLVVTNNVSLAIEPGERHAIIGPNGAGKTTLIHQIGGQIRPTRGRIFLNETEITGRSPEAISRAGLSRTFQRNNLFLGLEAIENVRLAVEMRHGNPLNCFASARKGHAVMEKAHAILQTVHLAKKAMQKVGQMSYGEQRQLEIALALAGEPSVLLLDEPTAGMSVTEATRMTELISLLPRSIAIVMIEHDMDVVFKIADRITVLYYGEVLASGKPDDIRGDERVRDAYLGLDAP
jgi:branched-chain amino acid transport system ATP-binding protein